VGHRQILKTVLRMKKIEIVVQTFGWFNEGSMALSLGFIGWARVHGRNHVNNAPIIGPARDNLFDSAFFSEVSARDK
jgi:hypothetical protein